MKNTMIMLLAAAAVALGVVCVVQSRSGASAQAQAAALQAELEAKSQEIQDLQANQKRANQQRHALMGQAEELAAKLQAQKLVEDSARAPVKAAPAPVAEPGKPVVEKGGLGKMLAKMMENPETRKFLQEQQRMMMDQMYGPLVKQLGLTPEEAAQFKDMLVENAMKATEKASSLLGGDGTTNRSDLFGSLTAEPEELR